MERECFVRCLERALRESSFRNMYTGSFGPTKMHELYDRKLRRSYFVFSADDISVPEVLLDELVLVIEPLVAGYRSTDTHVIGNGLYRLLGSAASPRLPSTRDYAKVLVLAAARIGPELVAELFAGWLDGRPVKARLCALLKGVKTQGRLEPAEGLCLETLSRNGEEFPRSLYVRLDEHDHRNEQFTRRAILSLEHEVGAALYSPEDEVDAGLVLHLPSAIPIPELSEITVDSLCRAMSIELNNHVDWFMAWWDYGPIEAFFLNPGLSSSRRDTGNPSPVYASQTQLKSSLEIREWLGSYSKLDRGIARWRRSKCAATVEERLVELRIALESVFLSDDKGVVGEKRQRLAMRGAWLLGKSFEERGAYFRALRDAYDLASRVIHAGGLREKDQKKLGAVDEAQDLCREAILLVARDRAQPNWLDVVLGKGLNCVRDGEGARTSVGGSA